LAWRLAAAATFAGVAVAAAAVASAAATSEAETTATTNLRNDNHSTASGTDQPRNEVRLNRKRPRRIAYQRKLK
uniref:Merozoite surface protein 2 n=1 Tax=Toxocara canis TaxID=6265 RepID=A0A183U8U8_TOXCA